MIGSRTLNAMIAERGPRWLVSAVVRQGEHMAEYADTAERAEEIRDRYQRGRYRRIQVHPPQGSVDLAALGRRRAETRRAYEDATAVLRAAVLRALEEGRAEAEVARTAGVDRMTVRSWAGKR